MRRILAAALLAAALIPGQAQALENEELLALVAMPLAVAAVSEMTDVPMNDLIDVVTLMNDAAVPPAQFVEVVRYAPVALVVEAEQPRFAQYVRVQYDSGLRGPALVNSIEERFQVYGINGVDLDVTAPRLVDVDDDFIPAIVHTRIAEHRSHPHGGPPGQLKKQLGVQTGAEVVHGSKPGKKRADDRVVSRVIDKDDRVTTNRRSVRVDDDDKGKGRSRGNKPARIDSDRGKGRGNVAKQAGNRGHGGQGGGGKAKGKGKG